MTEAPSQTLTFRVEPADGEVGRELMDAFAGDIAALYPGWHLGIGPSASPAELSTPHGTFLVGYRGAEPVACGAVKRLDSTTAEIKRMYVVPEARGRGVGRQLLVALEDAARSLGYSAVRLDTGDRQPHALALYRSAGYGEIADYNGNPAASFWLEKDLR